jgi:hypothetical protein
MWLPSDEPGFKVHGSLKKSYLHDSCYIRVLDKGNESILFIKGEKIVGAWHLDIESLEEFYENKAIEVMFIGPESQIEIYKMSSKLFGTIIELNEESKLSLPVSIDFIMDRYNANNSTDRDKLLLQYRIREPSEVDVEKLIDDYTK